MYVSKNMKMPGKTMIFCAKNGDCHKENKHFGGKRVSRNVQFCTFSTPTVSLSSLGQQLIRVRPPPRSPLATRRSSHCHRTYTDSYHFDFHSCLPLLPPPPLSLLLDLPPPPPPPCCKTGVLPLRTRPDPQREDASYTDPHLELQLELQLEHTLCQPRCCRARTGTSRDFLSLSLSLSLASARALSLSVVACFDFALCFGCL